MPCKNGPKPSHYSEEQLNKVRRALVLLAEVQEDLPRLAFQGLPDELKKEYNWSRWRVAPQKIVV